ncbi:putative metal homeostasis protein [Fundicoccus culcitae]|uniref:Metal homeostasis protein n=1 Tax=Fundicoccus culcitae TaxID=2969821 RepID=A0ABY5P9D4_9LACT|nr:putative metal homeostasis protein [Fundicoccus culcitae]UUX35352.1 putative metal homeostasis protein [Fundicoccus culcitae]
MSTHKQAKSRAYREMKSPNKKTARRALKTIKAAKRGKIA